MTQFKRFNASENDNWNTNAVYPAGTLTWDPDNGLRIHDGNSGGGSQIGGGSWAPGGNIVQNVDTDLRLVVQDPGENNYRLDLAIEDTSGSVKSRLEIDYDRVQIETWAGQNQWRFESSGQFRIPGNINTYDKDIEIIAMNAGSAGNITIKAVGHINDTHYSQVQLTQSGINITTDMDGTPGGKTFEFRDTGILVLPSGGDIHDSTGTSVLGGGSGSTLPLDAAGVLKNDGTGTLSWSSLDIQDLTDNGGLLNFTQQQADWTENNVASPAYIQNRPTLVTSYNELADLPTLFNGDYLSLTGTPSLANVATTGMYGDLSGTPTSLSDFYNDPGYVSGTPWQFEGYALSTSLALVATSGSYEDLSDKPTSITSFGISDGTPGSVLTTDGTGGFTFSTQTIPADVSDLTDNNSLLPAAQIRYVMKDANFTAEAGKVYWLDSGTSAKTMTLPASPTTGDWVKVYDGSLNWQTYNLTVNGNGNNVRTMNMGTGTWNTVASTATLNQAMISPVGPFPVSFIWNGTVWSAAM